MSKQLTIAYITSRVNPRFDWFINSLVREYKGLVDAQVIFIDFQLWYDKSRIRRTCIINILTIHWYIIFQKFSM